MNSVPNIYIYKSPCKIGRSVLNIIIHTFVGMGLGREGLIVLIDRLID